MFDMWERAEHPSEARRSTVLMWLVDRAGDLYPGMYREPKVPNLWYGRIPGTMADDGTMVQCSYFIYDAERRVKCDILASLKVR